MMQFSVSLRKCLHSEDNPVNHVDRSGHEIDLASTQHSRPKRPKPLSEYFSFMFERREVVRERDHFLVDGIERQ